MSDDRALRAFVQKNFTHDAAGAAFLLEGRPKEDDARIFQALPVDTAIRAINNLHVGLAIPIIIQVI